MRRNEIRSHPTRCRPHNCRFNHTTAGGDITQAVALTSFSSSFSYWLDGFGGDRHRDCRRPMSWLSGCRWGAWRSISSSVPRRPSCRWRVPRSGECCRCPTHLVVVPQRGQDDPSVRYEMWDRWFEFNSLQRRVTSEPWAKGTRDVDLDLASPLLGPAGDRHNRAQVAVSHGESPAVLGTGCLPQVAYGATMPKIRGCHCG
jgi:hypothetical protein